MKYIVGLLFVVLIGAIVWLYESIDRRNKAIQHLTAIVNIGNKQFPGKIEEYLILNRAYRDRLDVIYEYLIIEEGIELDYIEHKQIQKSMFVQVFCDTPELKEIVLREGMRMIHDFKGFDGQTVNTYVFSIEDC